MIIILFQVVNRRKYHITTCKKNINFAASNLNNEVTGLIKQYIKVSHHYYVLVSIVKKFGIV